MFLGLPVVTDGSVELTTDVVLPMIRKLEEKQLPAGEIIVKDGAVTVLPDPMLPATRMSRLTIVSPPGNFS